VPQLPDHTKDEAWSVSLSIAFVLLEDTTHDNGARSHFLGLAEAHSPKGASLYRAHTQKGSSLTRKFEVLVVCIFVSGEFLVSKPKFFSGPEWSLLAKKENS